MPKPRLDRFIEDYSEKGFNFAFKLCGNVEDAKELVQEAFVRLMRRWDEVDDDKPLENYFLSVLRNLYYDGLKRYEKRHCCSLTAESAPDDGQPEELADNLSDGEAEMLEALTLRDSQDRVNAAYDALPPDYRAVLALADVQGLSYDEIAAVLDCPGGTVRSRLSRARSAFRAKLLEQTEVIKQ